ncbi:hypothetical protein EYE35_00435 [Cereibacter sphaeroides]|nr:hypothetical protein EYE35_00435 [Cereibacter sphaeroides]
MSIALSARVLSFGASVEACRHFLSMLERQREGIAKAKAEGKYKGRKPTGEDKTTELRRLVEAEGVAVPEAAKRLGIGRATAYRLIQRAPAVA